MMNKNQQILFNLLLRTMEKWQAEPDHDLNAEQVAGVFMTILLNSVYGRLQTLENEVRCLKERGQ
jgi:hypothetical protein